MRSNQGQESVESKPISEINEFVSNEITPERVGAAINEMKETHESILSNEQSEMIVGETKATQGALEKFQGKTKRVITLGLVGLSLLAASPKWSEGAEKKLSPAEIEIIEKSFRAGKHYNIQEKKLSPELEQVGEAFRKGQWKDENLKSREELLLKIQEHQRDIDAHRRAIEELMKQLKGGK